MTIRDPNLNYAEPRPPKSTVIPDWLPKGAVAWDTCVHCNTDIYYVGYVSIFKWYHRSDHRASCSNQPGREVHDPKD